MDSIRNQIKHIDDQIQTLEDEHGPLNKEEIQKLKQQKEDLETEHQNKKKQLIQTQNAAKQAEKIQEYNNKLKTSNAYIDRNINTLKEKVDSIQSLDQLKQRNEVIEQLNKEDMEVINNEGTSPSDKAAAEARIEARLEEGERVNTEIAARENKMPLRERLKEIFKKGFTVTAVLLAVGTTIAAVVKYLTNGITSVFKAVGNNLKELGKKIGSILPGLAGAIASFVFRTAGQVISFLGKNAWLLILFVAAFLIEKITKKRRE